MKIFITTLFFSLISLLNFAQNVTFTADINWPNYSGENRFRVQGATNTGWICNPSSCYVTTGGNSSYIITGVTVGTIAADCGTNAYTLRMQDRSSDTWDGPSSITLYANGIPVGTFDHTANATTQDVTFTLPVGPILYGLESAQIASAATVCNNATANIGPGAYQDMSLAANTYYNFSWTGSGSDNGYSITVLSGTGTSGNVAYTTAATNNWYSGSGAAVIRVHARRNNCTWTGTSAVLTYRHSTPSTPTVGGGGAFCAASTNVTSSVITSGTSYWQNTTSGGTSTASSATPQSVSASGTYYYRGGNNGCWGTQGSAVVTLNSPNTAPSSISGTATICPGNTVTLTKVGGTGTAEWFTGSCGGTPAGTGNSIVVSPTTTTTYYVRSAANGVCPATACVNGAVTLPSQVGPLGNNNESATCAVTENNWVHFYHSSGRLLASINSGGQNLGNVTVTSYVDGAPALLDACEYPGNTGYQTSYMQRHWVITPSIQPASPVQVRLPFANGELATLVTASNANGNANDNVAGVGNVLLSKYSGPTNVDANIYNNCTLAGGTQSGATIHGQTANGVVSSYNAAIGASSYVDYTIPGFSEFWLHGSSNNSPLPVELTSFTANCNDEGQVELNWVTASEHNASHFVVEKSEDASTWKNLTTVDAAGNTTTTSFYSAIDETARGTNYYRLSQVDVDGTTKVYNQVASKCKTEGLGFNLFPNPAKSMVTIELNQKIENESSYLGFYDVNGKMVKRVDLHSENGNLKYVEVQDLMPGYYIVRLFDGQNENQPLRFIKQ